MNRILTIALLFFVAAILLSTGIKIDSSRAADSPIIAIAYSGMVMGYLEPCG